MQLSSSAHILNRASKRFLKEKQQVFRQKKNTRISTAKKARQIRLINNQHAKGQRLNETGEKHPARDFSQHPKALLPASTAALPFSASSGNPTVIKTCTKRSRKPCKPYEQYLSMPWNCAAIEKLSVSRAKKRKNSNARNQALAQIHFECFPVHGSRSAVLPFRSRCATVKYSAAVAAPYVTSKRHENTYRIFSKIISQKSSVAARNISFCLSI